MECLYSKQVVASSSPHLLQANSTGLGYVADRSWIQLHHALASDHLGHI